MLSFVYNTQCEDEECILGNQQSTTVAKPVVISQYTKYMGGVDKADHYWKLRFFEENGEVAA